MLLGVEQGNEDEPLHPRLPAGLDQVELAGPVDRVDALAVGRPGGGRIDHRVLALQGIEQAVGFEQVAPGELTAPFLQEGGLAG